MSVNVTKKDFYVKFSDKSPLFYTKYFSQKDHKISRYFLAVIFF